MKQVTQLAILDATACLGLTCTLSGQTFKLDAIRYDGFSGLVESGWESQPSRFYGLHSSTNLATWEELRGTGLQPFRIIGASGSRTQVEIDVLHSH